MQLALGRDESYYFHSPDLLGLIIGGLRISSCIRKNKQRTDGEIDGYILICYYNFHLCDSGDSFYYFQ